LPPGIEPVSPERLHGRALHLFLKSLAGRLRDRESVLYRLHRFRLIHRCCQSLCRSLRCEHTLQSVSDRRRHQTNIHSSARSAAPRIRARLPNQPSKPLMMCFIIAAQDEATLSRRNPQCPLSKIVPPPNDDTRRPDCMAGHVGLELRNVVANYPFEKSRRFAAISRILATETIRV
jgi:hypothetical protein